MPSAAPVLARAPSDGKGVVRLVSFTSYVPLLCLLLVIRCCPSPSPSKSLRVWPVWLVCHCTLPPLPHSSGTK
jgi:hypothetical protein